MQEVYYTPSQKWLERIRNFARQYLPDAAGETISTRCCLYTMTPDKHFVVDRHPHCDRNFYQSDLVGLV